MFLLGICGSVSDRTESNRIWPFKAPNRNPSGLGKIAESIPLRSRCAAYRNDRAVGTTGTAKLLNWIVVTSVARINRLASGKSFVLAVVKTDAIFAQLPAEIHFLIINARRKIQQAHVQVLHHASSFLNLVQRRLHGFFQAV